MSICKFSCIFLLMMLMVDVLATPPSTAAEAAALLAQCRVFGSMGWNVIPSARQADVSALVCFNLREALPSSSGSLMVYEAVNMYHTTHRHLLPTLPGWSVPELLSSLPCFIVQETELGPRLQWRELTPDELALPRQTGMWYHPDGFSDSTPWDCSSAAEDDPELLRFELAAASVDSSVFVPIRPSTGELVWSPSSPRYVTHAASSSDDGCSLGLPVAATASAATTARQVSPVPSRYSSSPFSVRGLEFADGISSSRRFSRPAHPRVGHRVRHSTPSAPLERSSGGNPPVESAADTPELWPLTTLADACRAAALALLVVSQRCNAS